ncbi:uncharacterized protein [Amphiura filiformis]
MDVKLESMSSLEVLVQDVAPCSTDRDRLGEDELEAVDIYTPTQPWQAEGMWFSDYTGYTESLEEADHVLQEYEIATGSKYVVNYKRANYGKTFLDLHKAKHKITWDVKSRRESVTACSKLDIPFDGVPFIFAGKKAYECRHGQDKGVNAKLKWKKIAEVKLKTDPKFQIRSPRIQPSMKLGCKAQVHITHIIRFPEYEVTKDTAHSRRSTSDKLRVAIHKIPFTLQPVDRFYLNLCDPKNHNHPLKDAELVRKAHNLRVESQGSHKKARKKRRSVPDEMALIQKELQMMKQDISAAVVSDHVDVTTTHAPVGVSDYVDVPITQSHAPVGIADHVDITTTRSDVPLGVSDHVDVTTQSCPSDAPVGVTSTRSSDAPVALSVSMNTNMPTISSPPNTVVATRCAKVLEKLINATFMVENADKLAELEQKANDLLKDANTSINEDGTTSNTQNTNRHSGDNSSVILPVTIARNGGAMAGTVPIQTDNTGRPDEEGCQQGHKRKATDDMGEGDDDEGEEEGDIVPVTQSIEYVNVAGGQPSIVYTYGTSNRMMYL